MTDLILWGDTIEDLDANDFGDVGAVTQAVADRLNRMSFLLVNELTVTSSFP